MSDAQPHVGDYWRRKEDGARVQVTRVWLKPGDPDPGVAYDIFGTLNGRPSKSTSAVHLSKFLEWFAPENPAQAFTEDRVREVVRQELATRFGDPSSVRITGENRPRTQTRPGRGSDAPCPAGTIPAVRPADRPNPAGSESSAIVVRVHGGERGRCAPASWRHGGIRAGGS